MAAAPKVEYWPTTAKGVTKWYYHRRARNGKIADPSQGYSTPSNCRRAIRNRWADAKIVALPRRPR